MGVRTIFFLVKILDWSFRQSRHIFVFTIISFQILWIGLLFLNSWFVDRFFSWFWGNITHSSAKTLSCWINSWFGSRWCARTWWALIRFGIIPKIGNKISLFIYLCEWVGHGNKMIFRNDHFSTILIINDFDHRFIL